MAINFNPEPGAVLIADFSHHKVPEITKRRPVIVVSPRLRRRYGLCAVVPCSTTAPQQVEPYHMRLRFDPPMPGPYSSPTMWVKADLIYTVSFERLTPPSAGKDANGKRIYDVRHISDKDLKDLRCCILKSLGLDDLTQHL